MILKVLSKCVKLILNVKINKIKISSSKLFFSFKGMYRILRSPRSTTRTESPPLATPKNIKIKDLDLPTSYQDHQLRDAKVKAILNDFLASTDYLAFRQYFIQGDTEIITDKYITKPPKIILKVWDKILSLYQIEVDIPLIGTLDSVIEIDPAEDKDKIITYVGIILPELCKFPYTFYKALKVRKFTFCGNATPQDPSKPTTYMKKYYNWNFYVNKHIHPEDIKKHFYRQIWYNILRQNSDINEQWFNKFPVFQFDKTSFHAYNNEQPEIISVPGYLNVRCAENPLIDQFEIFYNLLANPEKMLNHLDKTIASKAMFVKNVLEEVDTEGISFGFWKALGL
jgi:hypothetical protein